MTMRSTCGRPSQASRSSRLPPTGAAPTTWANAREAIVDDGDNARFAGFGGALGDALGGFRRADEHDGFGEHARAMRGARSTPRARRARRRAAWRRTASVARERGGAARVRREGGGDAEAEDRAERQAADAALSAHARGRDAIGVGQPEAEPSARAPRRRTRPRAPSGKLEQADARAPQRGELRRRRATISQSSACMKRTGRPADRGERRGGSASGKRKRGAGCRVVRRRVGDAFFDAVSLVGGRCRQRCVVQAERCRGRTGRTRRPARPDGAASRRGLSSVPASTASACSKSAPASCKAGCDMVNSPLRLSFRRRVRAKPAPVKDEGRPGNGALRRAGAGEAKRVASPETWPSGLRRRLAKALYSNRVSRVRIPASPPGISEHIFHLLVNGIMIPFTHGRV